MQSPCKNLHVEKGIMQGNFFYQPQSINQICSQFNESFMNNSFFNNFNSKYN